MYYLFRTENLMFPSKHVTFFSLTEAKSVNLTQLLSCNVKPPTPLR